MRARRSGPAVHPQQPWWRRPTSPCPRAAAGQATRNHASSQSVRCASAGAPAFHCRPRPGHADAQQKGQQAPWPGGSDPPCLRSSRLPAAAHNTARQDAPAAAALIAIPPPLCSSLNLPATPKSASTSPQDHHRPHTWGDGTAGAGGALTHDHDGHRLWLGWPARRPVVLHGRRPGRDLLGLGQGLHRNLGPVREGRPRAERRRRRHDMVVVVRGLVVARHAGLGGVGVALRGTKGVAAAHRHEDETAAVLPQTEAVRKHQPASTPSQGRMAMREAAVLTMVSVRLGGRGAPAC